jgi:Fic family protein
VVDIVIPTPKWDSNLASVILDLEKMRNKELSGTAPAYIFFQIKEIFHILETLGSARIEGNNTTLSEYVETIIEDKNTNESNSEIHNIELAIKFIEENTKQGLNIDRAFISQIHKIITKNLTPPPNGEGSKYPGELRRHNVNIKNSPHSPPDTLRLAEYFDKFIEFINKKYKEQNHLLMVAIAHHRFEHIHPFDNGNGRMGRLLNYSFLIKLGFNVANGRIINPSSIFYANRDKYYDNLAKADSLKDDDLLHWCEYFLLGLKNEIQKIDSLLDVNYVKQKILIPTILNAKKNEYITAQEYRILLFLIQKDDLSIKSEELSFLGAISSKNKSHIIAKLRDKNMIKPIKKNGRIYTIQFVNNYLLRGVMRELDKNGFIAEFLNNN